jgi:type I restriction enzyme M protein
VILPFVVLRRLDCILEATKPAVLEMASSLPEDMEDEARDTLLAGVVGQNMRLYNLSGFTFASMKGQDPKDIDKNLID